MASCHSTIVRDFQRTLTAIQDSVEQIRTHTDHTRRLIAESREVLKRASTLRRLVPEGPGEPGPQPAASRDED